MSGLARCLRRSKSIKPIVRQPRQPVQRSAWIGWLFALVATPAVAEVHHIYATFQPDSANPMKNQFKNQTPSEGFCRQMPQACEPSGLFSLIAHIPFTASAPILAHHADPRQGGMAKVPSYWRDVEVTHESGDKKILQLRIAGIGHEAAFPRPVTDLTGGGGWNELWEGGGWVYAPPPCQGVGWYSSAPQGYNSFWRVPEGTGVCAKTPRFDIPLSMRYLYFVYGYELRTPEPLQMLSGAYTGTTTYTVGPGLDFDMGDVMLPEDSLLTLNFSLEVSHTLKVDIPPGGNRVVLEPNGGWQSWLDHGRKPTRLFREQTFNISASSRFKMNLQCQYYSGVNCALVEHRINDSVPLEISVTLPTGLTDASGQPVNRRRLLRDGSGTELFQPGFYVDRKPGTLHFEIAPGSVEQMIYPNAERHYSGDVTIIWDSEVN